MRKDLWKVVSNLYNDENVKNIKINMSLAVPNMFTVEIIKNEKV